MDKRLVWVSAGLIFCLGVESAGLQLALLRVSTEFRLSPMMMGTFATVQYAAMLIVQPIFGVVSDKLGKKRIASGGVFVFIIGCLIASIAGAPLTFMAGVFVVGVGFSVVESMLSAAVTDAFPSKAEQYINLTQSLFCAGAMLSPIITNWLITEFGFTWRAAFVMADCGAAALAPFLLTTPFAKPLRGALSAEDKGFMPFLFAPFILLMLSMFLYGGLETGTASFLDSLFTLGLAAPDTGAYALSLFWLAMMLSRIIFGFSSINARKILLWCYAGVAIGLILLAISQTLSISLLAVGMIGFAMGPLWSTLVAFAAKWRPSRSGTAVTLMSAASGSGGALFPLILGTAVEKVSISTAFWISAFVAFAAVAVSSVYLRKR